MICPSGHTLIQIASCFHISYHHLLDGIPMRGLEKSGHLFGGHDCIYGRRLGALIWISSSFPHRPLPRHCCFRRMPLACGRCNTLNKHMETFGNTRLHPIVIIKNPLDKAVTSNYASSLIVRPRIPQGKKID